MTTNFLPDATDFTDIPLRVPPAPAIYVPCQTCHGHGKWNLTLNAYGPGRHFQAACGQCWSWGWVLADSLDATCVHTFVGVAPDQPWRCYHTDACTKCGRTRSYSSDD